VPNLEQAIPGSEPATDARVGAGVVRLRSRAQAEETRTQHSWSGRQQLAQALERRRFRNRCAISFMESPNNSPVSMARV
jgi:hypothetical protein